jgi:transposase
LGIHQLRYLGRRLQVLWSESAYGRGGLPAWVKATFGWVLQTVLRPVNVKGFVVLLKRWIVERTFAWLSRYRRLICDDERNTAPAKPSSTTTLLRVYAFVKLFRFC